MPKVNFGLKTEPAVHFTKTDDMIAVRTFSKNPVTRTPVPNPAAGELSKERPLLSFPESGVEVYKVSTEGAARSVEELKKDVGEIPDVRFAGGVFVDEQSGEPVVYTENFFIKFVDDKSPGACVAVITEAGLTVKQKMDYAENAYFVSAPEGTGEKVFEIASALLERKDVVYCHPEIIRQRSFRLIAPQQWHLQTTQINGTNIAASANVASAHATTQGAGVTIAIIDDGVDVAHREFRSAGKVVHPRDASLNLPDPRPKTAAEKHGTACAGVACADGNFGASGVAPRARLMPIRLSSNLGSIQEAEAFRWAADHGADVISCSWGPADGKWWDSTDPRHTRLVPLPASTKLAIDHVTTNGRNGKGCVVLFAAGNGNEGVEFDGYASYSGVIAVAACNDTGKRSVYSDFGDAVWCSFPSNDLGHPPLAHPAPLTPGIWTTDRSGPNGYNSGSSTAGDPAGDYTNSFGGTSSACPGAAGVAALVLSVNPDLTGTEVRDILKRCCDRIDQAGGQYDSAGRSKFYGFGRLNAEAAVRLAQAALNLGGDDSN